MLGKQSTSTLIIVASAGFHSAMLSHSVKPSSVPSSLSCTVLLFLKVNLNYIQGMIRSLQYTDMYEGKRHFFKRVFSISLACAESDRFKSVRKLLEAYCSPLCSDCIFCYFHGDNHKLDALFSYNGTMLNRPAESYFPRKFSRGFVVMDTGVWHIRSGFCLV